MQSLNKGGESPELTKWPLRFKSATTSLSPHETFDGSSSGLFYRTILPTRLAQRKTRGAREE